jgi:hypothetical protein
MDVLAVRGRESVAGLGVLNTVMGAFFIVLLPIVSYMLSGQEQYTEDDSISLTPFLFVFLIVLYVILFYAVMALVYVILASLSGIEWLGIQFFGSRRGWRITPNVARVICTHASVGWLVGGMLVLVGSVIGAGLLRLTMSHDVGVFRGPMMLAPIWMPTAGFFVGLLVFETLAYIGMHRMRFANRAKPETPKAPNPEPEPG